MEWKMDGMGNGWYYFDQWLLVKAAPLLHSYETSGFYNQKNWIRFDLTPFGIIELFTVQGVI